jgi:response regulator RpfG family c-di-GMP phosphodiesterase
MGEINMNATQFASCRILLVDSEEKIYRAISRILRSLSAEILWARNGAEAQEKLEEDEVALCLVDTRAPALDGNGILRYVASRCPGTRRMVLTGYADLDSTVDAINEGRIHRYFTKPWVNEALKDAVSEELSAYLAGKQARRREHDKNRKVVASSRLIEESSILLRNAKYRTAIDIQKKLIEFKSPGVARLIERIAQTSADLAKRVRLSDQEIADIRTAAELHRMGLFALPQALLMKLRTSLSAAERSQFEQYPVIGEEAIRGAATEDPVAAIIRSHREKFNGDGFPDRLVGAYIPLGARIVGLVVDFETITLDLGLNAAIEHVVDRSGYEYDPMLVNRLVEFIEIREDIMTRTVEETS